MDIICSKSELLFFLLYERYSTIIRYEFSLSYYATVYIYPCFVFYVSTWAGLVSHFFDDDSIQFSKVCKRSLGTK